jgi:hypothetical protein
MLESYIKNEDFYLKNLENNCDEKCHFNDRFIIVYLK